MVDPADATLIVAQELVQQISGNEWWGPSVSVGSPVAVGWLILSPIVGQILVVNHHAMIYQPLIIPSTYSVPWECPRAITQAAHASVVHRRTPLSMALTPKEAPVRMPFTMDQPIPTSYWL